MPGVLACASALSAHKQVQARSCLVAPHNPSGSMAAASCSAQTAPCCRAQSLSSRAAPHAAAPVAWQRPAAATRRAGARSLQQRVVCVAEAQQSMDRAFQSQLKYR